MAWAAPIAGAVIGGIMSKGGSGSGTQTVQKADPWEGVQPALRGMYDSALANFNAGPQQYYPGSTVANQSHPTQLAQQGIYNLAMNPSPVLDAAQQQAYSTMNDGYLYNVPGMEELFGMGVTNPMEAGRERGGLLWLGNDNAATNQASSDLYGSTQDQQNFFGNTPGMSGLQATASGDMLGSNPNLDAMFDQASSAVGRQMRSNVIPGIASMYSGAGRFGSGQMGEGLGQAEQQYGQTLNDLATGIYGRNYETERGLQQQAQGQLGQFGLANTGQRQAALGNLGQQTLTARGLQQSALGASGQLQATGYGLQQQALGQLGNEFGRERALQLNAMQLAPGLDQADYFGMGQLANVGAAQDAYNQDIINADVQRYNFGQNQPNIDLQNLSSILQGFPSGATTSQSGSGNPLLGILGGMNLGSSVGRNLSGMFGDASPDMMSQLSSQASGFYDGGYVPALF